MKKRLLIILCLFSVTMLFCKNAEAEELNTPDTIKKIFPDPVFANYIAETLNLSSGSIVSQKELDTIKRIYIVGTELESIEGLQYLNYASDFSLYNNRITDLSPFSGWGHKGINVNNSQAWHIWLTGNPITDLTPLTTLKIKVSDFYIHNIPIGNDQIENLRTISENWKIVRYSFGFNQIDDFQELNGTFVNRLAGYNDVTNYGHEINLGTFSVGNNNEFQIGNPSSFFDGTILKVSSVSNSGYSIDDDSIVSWDNLSEERPDNVSFTVVGYKTSVTYTINLIYDKFELTPKEKQIGVNKSFIFYPKLNGNFISNNRVKWESSNPEIASVSETGRVTGISKGEVIITGTSLDYAYSATSKVVVN